MRIRHKVKIRFGKLKRRYARTVPRGGKGAALASLRQVVEIRKDVPVRRNGRG